MTTAKALPVPSSGRVAVAGAAAPPVLEPVAAACPVRLVNSGCRDDCRCPFLALRGLLRLLQGSE